MSGAGQLLAALVCCRTEECLSHSLLLKRSIARSVPGHSVPTRQRFGAFRMLGWIIGAVWIVYLIIVFVPILIFLLVRGTMRRLTG